MPRKRETEKYKALGLCRRCGRELDSTSIKSCSRCLSQHRKMKAEKRLYRIKSGLCPTCGHDKDEKSKYKCSSCQEFQSMRKLVRESL
jgi:hypothetical protein